MIDKEDNSVKRTGQSKFSGHVLVAEDVMANQVLMKIMLNKMGMEVTTAIDGEEALEKALGQKFDLILMDIQMPRMDGYEATRQIRQAEPNDFGFDIVNCRLKEEESQTLKPKSKIKRVPIVALTSNALKGDIQKCLDAGCDGYLSKPIDRRELSRTLAQYLPASQGDTGKTIDSAPGQAPEPEAPGSKASVSKAKAQSREPDDSDITELINWDRLSDRLGGEDIVREVMPTYIKDIEKHFEKLSHALRNGDCASIVLHAHALKGAGRNLNIVRLSETAGHMERAGRENDIEVGTFIFNSLKREYEKVMAFLAQSDWIEKGKMV